MQPGDMSCKRHKLLDKIGTVYKTQVVTKNETHYKSSQKKAQKSRIKTSRKLIMKAQPSTMSSMDWKPNLDSSANKHAPPISNDISCGFSMIGECTLNSLM